MGSRIVKLIELSHPHLVLPNVRHNNCIIFGKRAKCIYNISSKNFITCLIIGHGVFFVPIGYLSTPLFPAFAVNFRRQCFKQLLENQFCITDNRTVNHNILINRRRIDINMNYFCIWRELFKITACGPVIKPCAYGYY